MPKTLVIAALCIALTACNAATREAATQYDTGAVVLEVSEPEAFNSKLETTDSYLQAYEAMKREDFPRAEALLEQALAQKPRDPYALLAMGAVMERSGRFYRASDYYRSAIRYGHNAISATTLKGGQDVPFSRKDTTVADVAYANLKKLKE